MHATIQSRNISGVYRRQVFENITNGSAGWRLTTLHLLSGSTETWSLSLLMKDGLRVLLLIEISRMKLDLHTRWFSMQYESLAHDRKPQSCFKPISSLLEVISITYSLAPQSTKGNPGQKIKSNSIKYGLVPDDSRRFTGLRHYIILPLSVTDFARPRITVYADRILWFMFSI